MEKFKVGIIGCGQICNNYMRGCRQHENLEIVACADIDIEKAKAMAKEYEVPRACTTQELLSDPDIRIVVNLTVPMAHLDVTLAAIAHGKNVHSEKPLAINFQDGKEIIDSAKSKGVRIGCAPDTFFGGGIQTCRKLIEDGAIGRPLAATAFMASPGPGSSNYSMNPDFHYKIGGGPMLDMGPYYLTALVNLLGPARRVAGSARASFAERTIKTAGREGEKIPVEVPTHLSGTVDFISGPIVTMIMSFDVWGHNLPRIEIYGSEGSLSVPDPNAFVGPVGLRKAHAEEWTNVPPIHNVPMERGIGVADMAYAITQKRPHRANGEMACHVLEIMQAFEESSTTGRYVQLKTTCEKPTALPAGLLPETLNTYEEKYY